MWHVDNEPNYTIRVALGINKQDKAHDRGWEMVVY